MMVVMTSWAPVFAFRRPANPAQTAPASAPAASASNMWSGHGTPLTAYPTQAPVSAPTLNWPSAPTLNSPPRNASPTANPARMYGVDQTSVSEMESAFPSEPSHRPPYASSGSPPVTQISSAPAASPVSTASACTSSVCTRV